MQRFNRIPIHMVCLAAEHALTKLWHNSDTMQRNVLAVWNALLPKKLTAWSKLTLDQKTAFLILWNNGLGLYVPRIEPWPDSWSPCYFTAADIGGECWLVGNVEGGGISRRLTPRQRRLSELNQSPWIVPQDFHIARFISVEE